MVEDLTVFGMKVGDMATWFGAGGSIAAVITALRLARSADRRHDREAQARGRVIASFLFAEVGLLRARLEDAINQAEQSKTFADQRANQAIDRVRQQIDAIDTTKFTLNLDKLADMPSTHGEFLAAVEDMKRVISSACVWSTAFPLPHDAHSKADLLLPQLRAMKGNADAFMVEYEPKFAVD